MDGDLRGHCTAIGPYFAHRSFAIGTCLFLMIKTYQNPNQIAIALGPFTNRVNSENISGVFQVLSAKLCAYDGFCHSSWSSCAHVQSPFPNCGELLQDNGKMPYCHDDVHCDMHNKYMCWNIPFQIYALEYIHR